MQASPCRPQFEQLEDRTVPSAWPFVQSIVRTGPATAFTNGNHVAYTVTFSEAVTGVDAADFALVQTGTINASISQVTLISGSVYTVTVDGFTGSGTLGLNLVDNGNIRDLSGDPLTQIGFPVSLQDPTLFATRMNSVDGVLADVNGDGIPDIICPDGPNGTVSVLLGNGNGTFQSSLTYLTGLYPTSVAVGDVNGDGHADLVVGNRFGSSVSVLLGNGDGSFRHAPTSAAGPILNPSRLLTSTVTGKSTSWYSTRASCRFAGQWRRHLLQRRHRHAAGLSDAR